MSLLKNMFSRACGPTGLVREEMEAHGWKFKGEGRTPRAALLRSAMKYPKQVFDTKFLRDLFLPSSAIIDPQGVPRLCAERFVQTAKESATAEVEAIPQAL
jgi:hypothetical protein